MVINQMQKTKVIIALVAVAVLTLTIVGLATAQITANQPYTATGSNNGFWGWMGRCFGFTSNQPYNNPYVAPPTAKVQFPPQVKATATTMDLDRVGHDLIQYHNFFVHKNLIFLSLILQQLRVLLILLSSHLPHLLYSLTRI
jgi:hypothetical protein